MSYRRHGRWLYVNTDRVTYRALGGAPVEWLLVNACMARIFGFRHRTLLRLLG
ncbi:hypothetical protein Pchl3084_2720 [Pseudomonas chlororaphis subsp. aureofaciens 30-84]|nr:hypothetical protein Pchl3084_2720 [Pseudomonas chlororaphis subsp. aureofaciens 30-84]